ncbi:hypothetical protein B0H11DRAFT_1898528 [Mycena galericulata]|nr:hypothetical protein B0H11DRAFT_1898528 [Mycena galericulata]
MTRLTREPDGVSPRNRTLSGPAFSFNTTAEEVATAFATGIEGKNGISLQITFLYRQDPILHEHPSPTDVRVPGQRVQRRGRGSAPRAWPQIHYVPLTAPAITEPILCNMKCSLG